MLPSGYLIGGLALAVLLTGTWIVSGAIHRKKAARVCGMHAESCNFSRKDHDIEHRALIYLMTQKTDSMLAALAHTIERERQKMGMVVINPSTTKAKDASRAETPQDTGHRRPVYDRILPLVGNGMSVSQIARELQLSESAVSMVMRLNAA